MWSDRYRAGLIAGSALWLLGSVSAAAAQDAKAASDADAADAPVDAAADDAGNDVIVTGVRKALETAARKKRNADTVVDSITATDIGAFPDKSVAEALQRVPGVTVIRSAAKDDVMHYSAEPSGVVIRGLQQVRSEFNGRDTFSATSGYGLSWSDISPELMSGVDTYKNQTAEMIEGGIAGTVNLRTRLPFDQVGQVATFNVTQNYGDKSQRATPDLSGIYSNRFDAGLGEFGVLANVAYSKVITNSRGVTLPRMMPFAPDTYVPGETSYIPSGIGVSDTDYNRERFGVSLAGQWKSKDGRLSATAQYNRSQYDTKCFREAVVARHVERIERLVLESFRSLVRKPDLIAALRIDPLTFSLAITGGDGGELRPDQLSAGERQLLAVALLWGMARASGRPLPTVIDTPLGRLDSEHRSRLVERYFPHASHQVILLSTDEEISGGYHAALKPWIGRSYHLAFDPVAGRTVIQDGYLADGGLRHVA